MSDSVSTEMFVRELSVESKSACLKIHQRSIGDVGVVVWDSGIVLGKYLDCLGKKDFCFENKKIIELGSGTGIVGLFAAALGADVILTDLSNQVPLLEKNIEVNKAAISGSATALAYKWGDCTNELSSPDVILLADCVYYEEAIDDLLKTIFDLSKAHTQLFISYEKREGMKQELVDKFMTALEKKFVIEKIPVCEQHQVFQSPDIHLLKGRSRCP